MSEVEDLLKTADKNFEKEKYVDSLRDYLAVIDKVEDEDLKAEVYYKISQIYHYLQKDEPQNALKYAQMSLDTHTKLGENDLVVLDLINIASILMDSGDKKGAIEKLDTAIQKAKDMGDDEILLIALSSKAGIVAQENKEEALKLYEEVMKKSQEIGDIDDYFDAVQGIVNIVREEDEHRAFEMIMKAIENLEDYIAGIKNKKERKDLADSFSYLYDTASDIAMSIGDVDQAMEIAKRLQKMTS
ncbi:hypothetical protein DMB44_02320 [Thermoplasma sp. Kam2015]|uniref:hypothetical protein n=1 Tax=Thermoplasma sp. Kam2015 TaxID=2094122 RepID=UPI000D8FC429|nr:hypothetical protein [Thermoplasma sp. Kam2015]PYB68729.1 hypothetical protein DMB44_02320 [Thermoplasma sp. Kam2015]